MAEDTQKPEESLSFEESLERLETLIEGLEDGEVPLAELVSKYEEGSKLLAICQAS